MASPIKPNPMKKVTARKVEYKPIREQSTMTAFKGGGKPRPTIRGAKRTRTVKPS